MTTSARFAIVETALREAMNRLDELPPTPESDALAKRAVRLDLAVTAWCENPPTEERRRKIVAEAMDLAVTVMRLTLGRVV